MLSTRFLLRVLAVVVAVLGASTVSGQTTSTGSGQAYPNKPIRIVTGSVGGAGDFASRLIAPGLAGSLGQQVITDNRSSGVIPGQIVSQAAPDGYTLLVYSSTLWIGPLMQKAPYDAVKDFAPITLATRAPNLLLVHPSVAANSVKELIALAKAKPGALNYASGGTGSSAHLAGELFKALAGVDLVQIPYKSNGAAINDLIGGQVQVMFATAGSAGPHVKSGKLRALAVTGLQPSPVMPGLPSVAASGVPGYEAESVTVIFAPAGTPATLINRLNQEIVRVLKSAEVKERFSNLGLETVGSSPAQLGATMKSEIARLGKVIKDAGIREQ